ncbi:hypothetical protein [Poseidonocella sp. HB161398]|uniref:hypothetical protein n=1 Tax=Poseidonocella sp. HB161398 TaxID=2320855 RepID=UPI00110831BB|nr:hypothetical protein [Poseidonocella sp. HB161398]
MTQMHFFLPLLMLTAPGTAVAAHDYLLRTPDIAVVERTLNLTAARRHPDKVGPDLTGILPGGDRVEVDLHHDGTLDRIEASRHGTMPLGEVMPPLRSDVAEMIYATTALTAGTRLGEMELGDEIALEAPGFTAEFTADGHLKEWTRD